MSSVSTTGNISDISIPTDFSISAPSTPSNPTNLNSSSTSAHSSSSKSTLVIEPPVSSSSSFSITINPTHISIASQADTNSGMSQNIEKSIDIRNGIGIHKPTHHLPPPPPPLSTGTPALVESNKETPFSERMNQQQEEMEEEKQMAQDVRENNERLVQDNQHIKGIGDYHGI